MRVVERRTVLGKCVRCTATSGDLALCNGCTVALRMELGDVAGILPDAHGKGHTLPSLPEDLHTSLSRQDQLADPNAPHHGGGDTPLVFRPHIGEAVWVLHQVLGTWAREIGFDPTGRSPRALARWLLVNLDRVQKSPDAAELADEVTDAIHQARRAIDRQDDDRIYLGPCGNQVINNSAYATRPPVTCEEELYGVPWLDRAQCLACGAEYRITDRREWLTARVSHYSGTAPEIAGFLTLTGVRCTPSMIRGYAYRHPDELPAVWANTRRHPEYLISDVLDALRDRYTRRKADSRL
jgi:hypothetical protein